MPVLNEADKIMLGTAVVDAVYLGDVKVWPPDAAHSAGTIDLGFWVQSDNVLLPPAGNVVAAISAGHGQAVFTDSGVDADGTNRTAALMALTAGTTLHFGTGFSMVLTEPLKHPRAIPGLMAYIGDNKANPSGTPPPLHTRMHVTATPPSP